MERTIYSLGYLGEGDYSPRKDGVKTIQYNYWYDMLRRCYNKKALEKRPTYEDKYVCEEWLNFQNFAKWFDENYYKINGERTELDKDIINKGNKIYSPETCVFVPHRINSLFIKCDKLRGNYPVGVDFHKDIKKFRVRCNVYDNEIKKVKSIFLGYSNTIEEAFYVYKEFKEKYIKQVADEYKDRIPSKLYEAMYNYIVDIDD